MFRFVGQEQDDRKGAEGSRDELDHPGRPPSELRELIRDRAARNDARDDRRERDIQELVQDEDRHEDSARVGEEFFDALVDRRELILQGADLKAVQAEERELGRGEEPRAGGEYGD